MKIDGKQLTFPKSIPVKYSAKLIKEIDDEKLKEIIDYDRNILKKILDKSKIYTTKILRKTVLDT